MKKLFVFLLLAGALAGCRHPEIEVVDFDTFRVTSVKMADVVLPNGNLNPEIRFMEDPTPDPEPGSGAEPETKVAYTNLIGIVREILGEINCNTLYHIAGTYTGHDVDGSPLTLSGKLLIPKDGPVKNLVIVSHYTIGANYEAPSETFPMEGIFAAKGYAVAIADYIGYGVTANRIHPYMHVESTARSVVDMALAVMPYLEKIGCKPQEKEVILAGYSQGGATTIAVMDMIQKEYGSVFPIKKVYAGGGPYDLAATYDISMEWDRTGIPCAIPMIVQGIDIGEKLGLKMSDFFQPDLLAHYDEWINSKNYTVKQINALMKASSLHEIMTENGRDKSSHETARLYQALMTNSVLDFNPGAPIYFFHSRQDRTVPFVNAEKAEEKFKGKNVRFDFGNYGEHPMGCARFIVKVYKDL